MKNRMNKTKSIKIKVSALTIVMIGLASGMQFSDKAVLAFTSNTPEIEILYEVETQAIKNSKEKNEVDKYIFEQNRTTSGNVRTNGVLDGDWLEDTGEGNSYEDIEDNYEDSDSSSKSNSSSSSSSYSSDDADYIDEDVIMNGSKYKNLLNTTSTENRFDNVNDEYKDFVKGVFSSKYYNKKFNLGYASNSRSWDAQFGNVYRLYNYIPMRKAIESRFGIQNVYGSKDTWAGLQASTLSLVLSRNSIMESALTNKENREYLAQLAVEAGITTEDDSAAPEAALACYYGIFNNDLSNTNYKYNPTKKMTRQQFAVTIGKFTGGWCYLDFPADIENPGSVYCGWSDGTKTGNIFNKRMYYYRNSKYIKYNMASFDSFLLQVNPMDCSYKQFTKGQISRIEVIRMLSAAYAEQSISSRKDFHIFNVEKSNYVAVSDSYIKKIIKKYGLSKNPTKYLANAKKIEKNSTKQILNKTKQFGYQEIKAIARCHKLGIISPNSNGKYNWYGSVTEAQALKMLTKAAIKCKTYYAVYGAE